MRTLLFSERFDQEYQQIERDERFEEPYLALTHSIAVNAEEFDRDGIISIAKTDAVLRTNDDGSIEIIPMLRIYFRIIDENGILLLSIDHDGIDIDEA